MHMESACKGRDKEYTMEQMKAKTIEKATMRPPEINPHKERKKERETKIIYVLARIERISYPKIRHAFHQRVFNILHPVLSLRSYRQTPELPIDQ